MGKRYIKLQNQGSIYQNLMLLYEMHNSVGFSDANGYFSKRAVAEIAINASIITSAGRAGDDILEFVRSGSGDESRNSVLQNAKARMQLLRTLGLVSTDYYAECYTINDFGIKVLDSVFPNDMNTIPSFDLLREAFMGVATTSEIYDYQCGPGFDCYLGYEICIALSKLGYRLGVDEMPIITTYGIDEIGDFVDTVTEYRNRGESIPANHPHYPQTQQGEPLQQPKNITRSINQILRLCNIFESKPVRIDGFGYYVCTEEGKRYVDAIGHAFDRGILAFLSTYEFRRKNLFEQRAACRNGYMNILERAQYECTGIDAGAAHSVRDKRVVFSPYQLIPETNADWLLGNPIRKPPVDRMNQAEIINSQLSVHDMRLVPKMLSCEDYDEYIKSHISADNIAAEVLSAKKKNRSREELVDDLCARYKSEGKDKFYSFVHSLLTAIGFDCHGEVGRFDALCVHAGHEIPMEIKSYAEAPTYNLKGLRQAVENKILSYKDVGDAPYSTLLLGFGHPSSLNEVQYFIDAAHQIWNVNIIAMDLRFLVCMCVDTFWNKQILDLDNFLCQYGIARV